MIKLKNLIIDGNAVLYRYFFGNINESIEDIISIAFLNLFYKTEELYKNNDIDNIVIVFDCTNDSWRKVYTSELNPDKITHKKYKGHRRETLTPKKKQKMKEFDSKIQQCVSFLKQNTSVLCLQENYLEGDDLIAGYIQMFPTDDHLIYSSDKDFLQLINSIPGNVRIIESQKDTERTLKDWDNDPELFLFEKCFRGEQKTADNIQNAYPRLYRTKILAAYKDNYKLTNIMNNEFEVVELDATGTPITYKYRTKDIFNENKLLMGLNNQPEHIRELIDNAINSEIDRIGKFNYLEFLKFCNNYEMERMIEEKNKFTNMLTATYRVSSPESS